jgi:hypothetical protein
VLTNLRRVGPGLVASSVLGVVVTVACVAGPAAAAQATRTAQTAQTAQTARTAQAKEAAATASTGIPAAAKNQLASELTAAWQLTDGHGVTVAVLDTPADHISELAGKMTIGPNYAPLPGASAVDGTVMASMIAGSGPTNANAFGTIGRAPGARILTETIFNFPNTNSAQEKHYQADSVWQGIVAEAIRYAVDHGASVIVVSEGGGADTAGLDSAVAYALSKNAVVIGSTYPGTGDATGFEFPDSLPGVINFSGVTISGLPAPQSTEQYAVNDSVLIAAPDNQLDATGPGNVPYTAWGYDSAVAWVAGTVALIKSLYPQISPAMVATALAMSASYHPAGGYNTTIGYGLINPVGALHEAATLVSLHSTAKPGPGVVSASARFGGTPPGTIHAVRHSVIQLAGFGAAIVVGAVLLIVAFRVRSRGRRVPGGRHSSAHGAALRP